MREGFKNEKAYLSNMFERDVKFEGKVYESSENIYMSFKNDSKKWKKKCVKTNRYELKKISRDIDLVKDWNVERLRAMRIAVFLKFSQNKDLKKKLSKEKKIVEWNSWGDKFWGKDIRTGVGENNLGKILKEAKKMTVKELKKEVKKMIEKDKK